MYIIRRPFKSNGQYYVPGQVITTAEFESIKLHKSRLANGKILYVPESKEEQNKMNNYFEQKFGVDIQLEDQASELKPYEAKGVKNDAAERASQARQHTPGTSVQDVLKRYKR